MIVSKLSISCDSRPLYPPPLTCIFVTIFVSGVLSSLILFMGPRSSRCRLSALLYCGDVSPLPLEMLRTWDASSRPLLLLTSTFSILSVMLMSSYLPFHLPLAYLDYSFFGLCPRPVWLAYTVELREYKISFQLFPQFLRY